MLSVVDICMNKVNDFSHRSVVEYHWHSKMRMIPIFMGVSNFFKPLLEKPENCMKRLLGLHVPLSRCDTKERCKL